MVGKMLMGLAERRHALSPLSRRQTGNGVFADIDGKNRRKRDCRTDAMVSVNPSVPPRYTFSPFLAHFFLVTP